MTVICTAGHVDHGKTTLVRALTGVDTDRLPEEKARGLSIALGYAPLTLPSGRRMSVIDVPGHERFVRTMVAGATGVDAFMMVVAADDGVMPQTREHAAVLRALDVTHGVAFVSKSDLADPGRASEAVAALLPGIEVAVNLGSLREALERAPEARSGRIGPAVLHVDRAFTIRGTGSVVTGTLWTGSVAVGDRLRLVATGRDVRVRAVQVHDDQVKEAKAGQRVALNLAGVSLDEIGPGEAVVSDGAPVAATTVLDARLDLDGARHNQRVQVHHGTRAGAGRLADLGDGHWQLRLEEPVLAADGDRVVVRSIAPPDTLGGGVIFDAQARRHGRAARQRAHKPASSPRKVRPPAPPDVPGAVVERLLAAGHEPLRAGELDAAHLRALRDTGVAVRIGRDRYAHRDAVAAVRERVHAICERDGAVTLASLRDDLGTSRQFAQALLEHFDAVRVTRRLPDDRRVLRRNLRAMG